MTTDRTISYILDVIQRSKKYGEKSICFVTEVQGQGKVFATQRGYGEFKDGWEFPGGKIEPGETPGAAIVREIKVHTAENISNHRVAAFGCNIVRIKLLYDRAVKQIGIAHV